MRLAGLVATAHRTYTQSLKAKQRISGFQTGHDRPHMRDRRRQNMSFCNPRRYCHSIPRPTPQNTPKTPFSTKKGGLCF